MLESSPNDKKTFPTPQGEIYQNRFPDIKNPGKIGPAESNNFFETARHNLINEKTFNLFVLAVTEKETNGSTEAFSFLHNRIVQECLNLSERDTQLIVNDFNRSVLIWFGKTFSPDQLDSRAYESIVSGKYTHDEKNNMDVRGVQNVIAFLKARNLILASEPRQEYCFYFNSKLDSRYSIDIIEEIGGSGGAVISLHQIKSRDPSQEEIEEIHADHARWVSEEWMNAEDYEKSYIDDGTEEEINSFLSDKERVEEVLLDFCTDPSGQELDKLMDSLHLASLGNKQKAWILWKYIGLIGEQLETAVQDGILDEITKNNVWDRLSATREKLVKKFNLPNSQLAVQKVKSVIAVGSRIISEREIPLGHKDKVINVH